MSVLYLSYISNRVLKCNKLKSKEVLPLWRVVSPSIGGSFVAGFDPWGWSYC